MVERKMNMENLINYFGLPTLIVTAVAGVLYITFTILETIKVKKQKEDFKNNFDIKV